MPNVSSFGPSSITNHPGTGASAPKHPEKKTLFTLEEKLEKNNSEALMNVVPSTRVRSSLVQVPGLSGFSPHTNQEDKPID